MCAKCGNKDCLVGEKCGNLESTSMLIEDGTMSAFHLNPLDTKVEVKSENKKNK